MCEPLNFRRTQSRFLVNFHLTLFFCLKDALSSSLKMSPRGVTSQNKGPSSANQMKNFPYKINNVYIL